MGAGSGSQKGSMYCFVKYLFISFNILVWLLGFGVLTVGVWMHVNQAPYSNLLPNSSFLGATVLVICIGAITLLIGFCGCCGAILESQCMLITYFSLVLIIFCLEVTATVISLSYRQEVENYLHNEVMLSINRDYRPELSESQGGGVVAVIDSIQQDLQCCGIDNQTDWYDIEAWPDQHNVPISCCIEPIDGCGQEESGYETYSRGCLQEIKYWLMSHMYTLGILALVLAVIQILAMSGAMGLYCCIRKDKAVL